MGSFLAMLRAINNLEETEKLHTEIPPTPEMIETRTSLNVERIEDNVLKELYGAWKLDSLY